MSNLCAAYFPDIAGMPVSSAQAALAAASAYLDGRPAGSARKTSESLRIIRRPNAQLHARGWPSSNLKYMRFFAQHCPDGRIGQQPADQLPWFHIVTLLTGLGNTAEREWYAAQTVQHGECRSRAGRDAIPVRRRSAASGPTSAGAPGTGHRLLPVRRAASARRRSAITPESRRRAPQSNQRLLYTWRQSI